MRWFLNLFRPITNWLGRVVRQLLGEAPREQKPGTVPEVPSLPGGSISRGPQPRIVRFNILYHRDCEDAWFEEDEKHLKYKLTISYEIDPNGATISGIEVLRVYAPDDSLPEEALVRFPPYPDPHRLPTGEYFESVERMSPVSPGHLSRSDIVDDGLETGHHFGHTLYYRQYMLNVWTPDNRASERKEVRFSAKPKGVLVATELGVVWNASNPRLADTRLYLDNVKRIEATKHGAGTPVSLTVSPNPIEYAAVSGGLIEAHLCLRLEADSFRTSEEVTFQLFPFEENLGGCPVGVAADPLTTQIGTGTPTGCP